MIIPKQEMKKWINALRSGDYKQGNGTLQNGKKYCCLGVACELFIPRSKRKLGGGELYGAFPDEQPNAPGWLKGINYHFSTKMEKTLGIINDFDRLSFNEIADLLQLVYIEKALN